MSIHHNLRCLRLDSGMTQEQVAEKAGVTRQAISSYESGRTRPDLDMLMRLSGIYGTDLEGVVYGREHILKSMRRVKAAALIIFAVLTGSVFVSSAFLWSANHFFAVPPGQMSPETMMVFAFHRRLTGAWEAADRMVLTLSLLGFSLLLIFAVTGKYRIPLRAKIAYLAGLAAAISATALLFGMADPVFTATDYIITPALVIGRMIFFLMADLVIEFIQKRRSGN